MKIDSRNSAEQVILHHAELLFLERGFALTSTVEIARSAGCNQALIHYYFRTKEQLFERVFEEKLKLFVSTLLATDNPTDSFEKRLKNRIEAHFDILAANPKLPFLIINEVTTNPKRIEKFRLTAANFMADIAQNFQQELDEQIKLKKIRPIEFLDLLINVIALNASIFLMLPVLEHGFQMKKREIDKLVKNRRTEIVAMVLNSLKV